MPIEGFNHQKCSQRNRIAAARFGVNTAPLKFKGSSPDLIGKGFLSLKEEGLLPLDMEQSLSMINALLPEGASALTSKDVYIHFYEAANSNFVSDRSLYLGESTLKNIASGASSGISFMNSHRTGGLSSPAELPFGQTFAGSYQEGVDEDGVMRRRATVALYMLRGVKPNGDAGPSTDDLHRLTSSGAIKDVSVGIGGGEPICDVCGHELNATKTDKDGYTEYLCPHIPGTHEAMSEEEIESQIVRDPANSHGYATYTLEDAKFHEVSAVYDGAVPGAGIQKVMQFAKGADLSKEQVRQVLQEAHEHYGALLPFDLSEVVEIKFEDIPSKNTKTGENMSKEDNQEKSLLQKVADALGIDYKPVELKQETVEIPSQESVRLAQELKTAQEQLVELKKSQEKAEEDKFSLELENFTSEIAKRVPPALLKSEENEKGFDAQKFFSDAHKAGLASDAMQFLTALSVHPMQESFTRPEQKFEPSGKKEALSTGTDTFLKETRYIPDNLKPAKAGK